MHTQYRHTQIGWVVIGTLVTVAAVIVPVLLAGGVGVWVAVCGAMLAVVLLLFGTLTVCIDDRSLRLHFGVGLIRKRFALSEIRSYRPAHNKWYYGWGIRFYPGGILYNVSGLQAVEIVLEGGSRFRIGTDEPAELVRALENAVGPSGPVSADHEKQEQRGSRRWAVIAAVAVVAIVATVAGMFYFQMQPPEVTVDRNGFTVDSLFYGDGYAIEDITDVSLEERLPRIVARTNGFEAGGVLRGWFRVEGLGKGKLFVKHGRSPYLVVRLRQGFVIINFKDPDATRVLFEELIAARSGS